MPQELALNTLNDGDYNGTGSVAGNALNTLPPPVQRDNIYHFGGSYRPCYDFGFLAPSAQGYVNHPHAQQIHHSECLASGGYVPQPNLSNPLSQPPPCPQPVSTIQFLPTKTSPCIEAISGLASDLLNSVTP